MGKFFKTVIGLAAIVAIIGGITWAAFNRQQLIDRAMVATYNPSSKIVALAKKAGFSDKGEFYFYASRPELSNRQSFNKHCRQQNDSGSGSVVLGCYVAQRIYIYNVTDSRLDGIRATTAAHEMLHAAYERLDNKKRQQVDSWLEAEFKTLGNNAGLQEQMAVYAKSEPGEEDNELHSVLATQIGHLSPQLEEYYSQYFTNRQIVVGLFSQYNHVLTNLQAQQNLLVNQLNQLASQINANTVDYNASINQLNDDIASFNERANTEGGFNSQAEFNARRQALIARQNSLTAQRNAINQTINEYNQKRQQLEALNLQAKSINRSIDSTLQPVPSV